MRNCLHILLATVLMLGYCVDMEQCRLTPQDSVQQRTFFLFGTHDSLVQCQDTRKNMLHDATPERQTIKGAWILLCVSLPEEEIPTYLFKNP